MVKALQNVMPRASRLIDVSEGVGVIAALTKKDMPA